MNRTLPLIALFLVASLILCNAQDSIPKISKTVFGVKLGVNCSKFSASINSESRAKAGLALGFYLKTQIGRYLYFRPEIYYSNQGQKDNYLYQYGSGPSVGRTTTAMHYVNLPILLEVGKKVTFQFGLQLGILVKGTEKGTIQSVKVNDDLNGTMAKTDVSAVFGVGLSPTARINCGARVNLGVSNIYTPDTSANQTGVSPPTVENRVLHFYVGYSF